MIGVTLRFLVIAASVAALVPSSLKGQAPTSPLKTSVGANDITTYPQILLKGRSKDVAVREWLNREAQDQKADWKTTIRFYGKVLDQDSVPIPDANVSFQWTDLSVKGTSSSETKTDQNGRFSLSDVRGKRLIIRVTKKGYDMPPLQRIRNFEFANPGEEIYYEPDETAPAVFQMWRLPVAEPMIKHSGRLMVACDGTIGNLETAGEGQRPKIQVQAWKPWPPRMSFPRYDWKLRLTILSGGFAEARDDLHVEAPESGYSSTYEVNMPATAADWNVGAERMLYLVYGEPKKYGRIEIKTNGDSRYIFFDYVLNPSGSRNLHFDPAKQIKQP